MMQILTMYFILFIVISGTHIGSDKNAIFSQNKQISDTSRNREKSGWEHDWRRDGLTGVNVHEITRSQTRDSRRTAQCIEMRKKQPELKNKSTLNGEDNYVVHDIMGKL